MQTEPEEASNHKSAFLGLVTLTFDLKINGFLVLVVEYFGMKFVSHRDILQQIRQFCWRAYPVTTVGVGYK